MNKNLKIILVDDDAALIKTIVVKLSKLGYHVLSFLDATEAKNHLLTLSAGDIDVLIVDYMMPGISGIDFLEAVAKCPTVKDIPIIMLSGTTDITIVQQAFSHGVTVFVCKDQHTASYIDSKIQSAIEVKEIQNSLKKLTAEG